MLLRLSVVILNYNVSKFLYLCLQSVETALNDIDAEIIVVDNKSNDDSVQMVEEHFAHVKLIRNAANYGFAKGNNIGVEQAEGDYVCILNPDTVVPEDAFLDLLAVADKQPDLGALGCQLIDGTGRFLPESKRHVPTPFISLKKILGYSGSYYYEELNAEQSGSCDVLVGALMVLKRDVYLKVGGFDESYFMYGEDIDLSYELLKAGYQNYYVGSTTVLHFKGESTLKDAAYAKRFYGAMRIFYKKHFKSNIISKALVNLAIQLAYLARSKAIVKSPEVRSIVHVSKFEVPKLKNFNGNIKQVEKVNAIGCNTMVIYDASFLSFKSIIGSMKQNSLKTNLVFRIQPKKANFIIGSDSNLTRGEVVSIHS